MYRKSLRSKRVFFSILQIGDCQIWLDDVDYHLLALDSDFLGNSFPKILNLNSLKLGRD